MFPPASRLALKRRLLIEQRLIRVLRVLVHENAPDGNALRDFGFPDVVLHRIWRVVQAATGSGYSFRPPGSAYVTMHELHLVGLLAQAQRERFKRSLDTTADLDDAQLNCAMALDAAGVRLPPNCLLSAEGPILQGRSTARPAR